MIKMINPKYGQMQCASANKTETIMCFVSLMNTLWWKKYVNPWIQEVVEPPQ